MTWLIYGANGYTGVLVAEEAKRRGHKPVLAGRSIDKVRPLAERLGLESKAFSLDDPKAAANALEGIELVFHAAGPFVITSAPMIRACLDAKAHYVDITGEIPVFEATFEHHDEALKRGVCLMSGVGFDVIPTDCLAKYVAEAVPDATDLEIAISAGGSPSAGTTKSMIELMPKGNLTRRDGKIISIPSGSPQREVRFSDKARHVMGIPWGDVSTAYRSTKIPNITTYMAMKEGAAKVMGVMGPMMGALFSIDAVKKLAQSVVEKTVAGPNETARESGRSYVWASARGPSGEKEAWLETMEGYRFTAIGGVRSVERLLEKKCVGALTPSLAFGADFVTELDDTKRYDVVPG